MRRAPRSSAGRARVGCWGDDGRAEADQGGMVEPSRAGHGPGYGLHGE
ncbi:hypothetical protein DUI70_2133 [Streptomyces albus]|nr:hypothetical protein DUI70_2133 [Streptomyces albus]